MLAAKGAGVEGIKINTNEGIERAVRLILQQNAV